MNIPESMEFIARSAWWRINNRLCAVTEDALDEAVNDSEPIEMAPPEDNRVDLMSAML